MADIPQLFVYDKGATQPWGASAKSEKGKQFDLQYKVIPNGKTSMRIEFPIYDPNDTKSVASESALMNIEDWNNTEFTIISPTSGISFSKTTTTGVCSLTITGSVTETIFKLNRNGTVSFQSVAKNVVCNFRINKGTTVKPNWVIQSSINVELTQDINPPFIAKFTAERMVLASGGNTTLNWTVSNYDEVKLWKDSVLLATSTSTSTSTSPINSYSLYNLQTDTTFRLEAKKGGIPISKELTIKAFNSTDIAIQTNTFVAQHEQGTKVPERKLMNLYVYEDKIYALVLEESTKDVYMWESYEGFNWTKTVLYSNYVSFANAKNSNIVPLHFAGSPSVVFDGKVFLIGGSKFNPNIRSNEVYFYDYNNISEGWQKMPAPAPFSPRMGHSCVVYNNNSQIWVLGGCTEFGASNEIWTFDGTIWAKFDGDLPENRAMASVIVMGDGHELQIFGGVGDIPGTPDKSILNSYSFSRQKWTKIEWANGMENPLYLACEVGVIKGVFNGVSKHERFIFSTINSNATYIHRCQRIESSRLEAIKQGDWLIPKYIYHIQAVTFKGVIWLCSISQDVGIQSNNLRYLAYVPK